MYLTPQFPLVATRLDPVAAVASDRLALELQFALCRQSGSTWDALAALTDRAFAFVVPRLVTLMAGVAALLLAAWLLA